MIVLGREELADTPESWPVVDSEVLAHGAIVDLVEDQIQTPSASSLWMIMIGSCWSGSTGIRSGTG